ncbi:MAG: Rieske 2Fe-2S domain-containing protein [Woeseiaceae bacterium]
MFLRNAWYVAGLRADITRELAPLTILGERIVFYRKHDGTPVALEDACPHRKLPLSKGRLREDAVECGYHGLKFDCTGKCIAAPTQKLIPASAQVKSFPCTDQYGLVWIWMGEPGQADTSLIPSIENYDNPTWKITSGDAMDCACDYLHLVDNLLDPSHVAWVHASSFAAAGTEDTDITMQISDDGVIASRWILDQEPPPFYADLVKTNGSVDRFQYYEVQFPSCAINKSIYTAAGKGGSNYAPDDRDYLMVSYNFLTPVDEDNTRYYWLQHRNTDPHDDEITKKIAAGARTAFEEDREILEAVHEGLKNASTPNITLGVDAAAVQFRRALHKKIEAEQNAK